MMDLSRLRCWEGCKLHCPLATGLGGSGLVWPVLCSLCWTRLITGGPSLFGQLDGYSPVDPEPQGPVQTLVWQLARRAREEKRALWLSWVGLSFFFYDGLGQAGIA